MELEAGDPARAEELLARRLRDLILRFPSGLLEGVRWSILSKVYADRFPDGPHLTSESMGMAARAWLVDIAELVEDGSDRCFRVLDGVALRKGADGQLACWPLLVRTLAGIVRLHGSPQAPREGTASEAAAEKGSAGDGADEGREVLGVLLSQLKPLLIRHWDPNFQERAVGYFNEDGSFVSVKKMKHLVAAVLEWRARRLARRGAAAPSAVDEALEATPPLLLQTSQRHNDMVLCCPKARPGERPTEASVPPEPFIVGRGAAAAPSPAVRAALPATPMRLARLGGSSAEDFPSPEDREAGLALRAGDSCASGSACSPCTPPRTSESQRLDVLEKESRRLRIENAELKKRLRFDSEFLHKQIRRLRIENAELKKRVFFSSHYLASSSHSSPPHLPHLPLQPVWVPASTAVFAPVVAGPGPATAPSGASAPSEQPACSPSINTQAVGSNRLPPSGQVSPAQGSLTPVPHGGFCYALPLTQGVMSPVGQPWPSALGHFVAVPIGAAAPTAGSAAVMSPFSDRSQQERLLPKSLLGSDPGSSSMSNLSDNVSPDYRGEVDGTLAPAVRFQGTDDRWVCIPSGIVERHKAQFEATPGAGEGAVEAPASSSGEVPPAVAGAAAAAASASMVVPAAVGSRSELSLEAGHARPAIGPLPPPPPPPRQQRGPEAGSGEAASGRGRQAWS